MDSLAGKLVTLSLCMIVKNEAGTLERCLASARPHVDEIVVVDTGSTDSTPEIAGRYADVLRAIEWPGSFSVARNVAMDAATGDYILTLDADEYIEDAQAWATIRRAVSSPSLLCAYLPVFNVLSEGVLLGDIVVQPRIVRNAPEIRWSGMVHNQIEHHALAYGHAHPELEKLVLDAQIVHTGYDMDAERRKNKHIPRLPMLREMAETTTGNEREYYRYQLACTLHSIGEIDEANALFAAMQWDLLTTECRTYGRNLAALTAPTDADGVAHAEAMLEAAPHEPAALHLVGCALADAGEIRRGLLFMCEAWLQAAAGRRCRMVLRKEFVLEQIANLLGVDPDTINSPRAIRQVQARLVTPVDLSFIHEHIDHEPAAV